MNELIDLWNRCLRIIEDNLSGDVFLTWFKPILPLALDKKQGCTELTLAMPSMFFCEYIDEKYSDLLRATLRKVLGREVEILYRVTVDSEANTTTDIPTSKPLPQTQLHTHGQPQGFSPFNRVMHIDVDSQLNPHYRFDNFIEGKGNKLVRQAGLSVASSQGKNAFNPLFIFGASGTGKTHIANAIGMETLRLEPTKRVLYVSASLFQIQYTDAVRQNKQNDFLNFYQSLDVLIVDDIHDFISKSGTQNTFFTIFNHLHRMGKQIILTCDRQPSELEGMEERLITRFRWGLTAELAKADFSLRKGILQYKIKQDGLVVDEEVVDFIAERVTASIRDLEGVLISLMAHSTINNQDITVELAKKVIGSTPASKRKIDIADICKIVCQYYSLSEEELNSRSRKATIAQPRQVAMYLARKHTTSSLDSIAETIGKRTHATVIHSCKLIHDLLASDKILQRDIQAIEAKIK